MHKLYRVIITPLCSFLFGHFFFMFLLNSRPYLPDVVLIPLIATTAAIVGLRFRDMYREDVERERLIREILSRPSREQVISASVYTLHSPRSV